MRRGTGSNLLGTAAVRPNKETKVLHLPKLTRMPPIGIDLWHICFVVCRYLVDNIHPFLCVSRRLVKRRMTVVGGFAGRICSFDSTQQRALAKGVP